MPSCSELMDIKRELADFQKQCVFPGRIQADGGRCERLVRLIEDLANAAEAAYDYELGGVTERLKNSLKQQDWQQMERDLGKAEELFAVVVNSECGN